APLIQEKKWTPGLRWEGLSAAARRPLAILGVAGVATADGDRRHFSMVMLSWVRSPHLERSDPCFRSAVAPRPNVRCREPRQTFVVGRSEFRETVYWLERRVLRQVNVAASLS